MRRLARVFLAMCLIAVLASCAGNAVSQQESGKAEAGAENGGNAGAGAAPQTEASKENEKEASDKMNGHNNAAKLMYLGHASLRLKTADGKIIYIDPFAGSCNDAADLILVTHGHFDHNQLDKVEKRNPGCQIITWKEALKDGKHQSFDLGYVNVEAVEAGYNTNHNVKECVGYILTMPDGVSVYVSGDTSKTKQMPELAAKNIDYAFFCCDGVYNMDLAEAAECADLVKAKHNIPYHMISKQGVYFDRDRANQFQAPNRLIIGEGEEIELSK